MNKKALVIMIVLGAIYFYLKSWVAWRPVDGSFTVRMPRGAKERGFVFDGPEGDAKINLAYSSDGSCGYYVGNKNLDNVEGDKKDDDEWLEAAGDGFILVMERGKVSTVTDIELFGLPGKKFTGTAFSKGARRAFDVKGRVFIKDRILYVQFTIGDEDEEFFESFQLKESKNNSESTQQE